MFLVCYPFFCFSLGTNSAWLVWLLLILPTLVLAPPWVTSLCFMSWIGAAVASLMVSSSLHTPCSQSFCGLALKDFVLFWNIYEFLPLLLLLWGKRSNLESLPFKYPSLSLAVWGMLNSHSSVLPPSWKFPTSRGSNTQIYKHNRGEMIHITQDIAKFVKSLTSWLT